MSLDKSIYSALVCKDLVTCLPITNIVSKQHGEEITVELYILYRKTEH